MGRGARQSRNAGAEAVGRPEAVAAAVYEAVETAAQGLHTQAVGNGKSGADMLQCPENRAVAARWRSGDPGRRVTAALARAMQALQEWAGGPQRAQASTALPGPADPLPVRRNVVAATARSPSSWFSGLRNFRWRTLAVVLAVFLFPRVWALLVALLVRLISRAVLIHCERALRTAHPGSSRGGTTTGPVAAVAGLRLQ